MSYANDVPEGATTPTSSSSTTESRPRTLTTAQLAAELRLSCMRISRRVRFESTNIVAPNQFSVLSRLEKIPCTPRELAEIERVSAPSMTRTVAGLVDLGLVSRADDPDDGRQVILSLTEDGKRTLREIRRHRDQWMATRIKNLTSEEREVLSRASAILERVANE
ncbi:MAG TPA: MarR family transcriptional regulator [Segeticoccus sp.]|uniref:MarR family winged helix-turn-helix transcriptional regulator n=1 Tax=Segeticoccus sp. TaxID=2706531 RepID=UPI002D7F318A|nr:MarR family transcriptional regulator [Segeticoccus sp.]HET8601094.1 MarR family transcriptional regulator [Segeticoccus sp.]